MDLRVGVDLVVLSFTFLRYGRFGSMFRYMMIVEPDPFMDRMEKILKEKRPYIKTT